MEGKRPSGRPRLRWKGSALEEDPGGDGREAPWRKTQGEMEGKSPSGRPRLRWKGSALEEDPG